MLALLLRGVVLVALLSPTFVLAFTSLAQIVQMSLAVATAGSLATSIKTTRCLAKPRHASARPCTTTVAKVRHVLKNCMAGGMKRSSPATSELALTASPLKCTRDFIGVKDKRETATLRVCYCLLNLSLLSTRLFRSSAAHRLAWRDAQRAICCT